MTATKTETKKPKLKGEERNKAINAIIRVFFRLGSPAIRALATEIVDGGSADVGAYVTEVKKLAKEIPSPVTDLADLPEELRRATRGNLDEAEVKYILELKNKCDAPISQVSMERALNHTVIYHLYKGKGLVEGRGGKPAKPKAEKKARTPKAAKPKQERKAASSGRAKKATAAEAKGETKAEAKADAKPADNMAW